MTIIIGAIVVIVSVLGGFMIAGGNPAGLVQPSEFVVIIGAAVGAMIIMAPKKVLLDTVGQTLGALKGGSVSRAGYDELFKALYEIFMLARRNGMIALEDHVSNPTKSAIFSKYPLFLKNHHAVELLCSSIRPLVDGRVKPDQLGALMDAELNSYEEEHHQPVELLTKVGDAMPGFGIVAAVLGIVNTMAAINGPIDEIGHHVAAALVGTFLGILIAYGFISPLAAALTQLGQAEMCYLRSISQSLIGFANGAPPMMAVEIARRSLPSNMKPSSEEFEQMLKAAAK